ncbi:MAG: nucleotide exchange factor GrpE [Sulfitobacter sp.]|nr:nucleotide exchange factor GrpE [Sulfitobacter sp.]
MSTTSEPQPVSPVSLEELAQKVDYLGSLFQRRLLNDKERLRAFEDLQTRLGSAEDAAAGLAQVPLARELFLVIDRLDRYEGSDREFVDSVRDEILESLRRHHIDELVVEVGQFDPATTEVGELDPSSELEPGSVVGLVRRGYRSGSHIVRAASVRVAAEPTDDQPV